MSERRVMNPLNEYCPDLVKSEWFVSYNDVLGIAPSTLSKDSVNPVYWKCPKCSAVYCMSPKKKLVVLCAERSVSGQESYKRRESQNRFSSSSIN